MIESKTTLIIYLKEIGVDFNDRFTNQIDKVYEDYRKDNNLE